MSLSPGVLASIRRAMTWGGGVRGPSPLADGSRGTKEWLHFSMTGEDLDVLVNFSLMQSGPAARAGLQARLLCAVRTDGWDGDIDHYATDDVQIRPDGTSLRFGSSSLFYEDGAIHVSARLARRPVAIDLTLTPVVLPSIVNDIRLCDGPPWHWFVAPRLAANGHVTVGHRLHDVRDRPAYHDHNWGRFLWGDDFSWTWGYGHGHDAEGWTIACDRLANRSRTVDRNRGIILWKGPRQHRIFSGRCVAFREEGRLRTGRTPFRLPRALSLLAQGDATDVPARFEGHARSGNDALDFEFRSRDVCQILVPDDDGLGLTVLDEVSGEIEIDGEAHGEPLRGRGTAAFEFLHG